VELGFVPLKNKSSKRLLELPGVGRPCMDAIDCTSVMEILLEL
jgi:hypothetical protein